MGVSAFVKDPNASLPYGINWELDVGDSIATSVWSCDIDGVTITFPQYTNTPTPKTLVRVSGGTGGVEYPVVNRITTANGSVAEHTLLILVEEQ